MLLEWQNDCSKIMIIRQYYSDGTAVELNVTECSRKTGLGPPQVLWHCVWDSCGFGGPDIMVTVSSAESVVKQ